MATSLESIIDGKEEVIEQETTEKVEETQEPEKVEPVEETTEEVTEEPAVEETPEPTGEEETTPPVVDDVKTVPLAAVLDERDKRKELQKKVELLEAEKVEAEKEKVDFWENPEAAVDAKVEERVSKLEQQRQNDRIADSMQLSKHFHEDFDIAKDAFIKAAEDNPALAEMAIQSEIIGEYIYTTGKQFMELDAAGGDVNALRDKIRLEERAKIMEELKSKEDKLKDVPTPLTDEASATAPREKVEGGSTPLDNIFTTNR